MTYKQIIFIGLLVLISTQVIAQSSTISGNITNFMGDPIPNIMVRLTGGTETINTSTDSLGQYQFQDVGNGTYTIEPLSPDNPLNGVSTFDLVLCMKEILRLDPFETPYQRLAGDVNKTGTVSMADVWQMRQVILGMIPNFELVPAWYFVPRDFDFPEGVAIPTSASVEVNQDIMALNFVAVKSGDVNGSAWVGN